MALILSLESSTEVCSVALARDGNIIDLIENQEGLNHAKLLTSYVETIFKKNNISAFNIDAVAVSKGPGSYTGLRIGVSAAKGLCYAANKPLIAISTLESMAKYLIWNPDEFGLVIEDNTLLCPMIDARRMEVYNTIYNNEGRLMEPISARIVNDSIFAHLLKEHEIVFFGNGAEKCKSILNNKNALFLGPQKASARFMAILAEEYFVGNEFEDVAYFEPFYLKDFIATIPKNKII